MFSSHLSFSSGQGQFIILLVKVQHTHRQRETCTCLNKRKELQELTCAFSDLDFLKAGRKYVFAGNDELLEAGVSSPRGSELRLQVGQEIQGTVQLHFSSTNSTCSSILFYQCSVHYFLDLCSSFCRSTMHWKSGALWNRKAVVRQMRLVCLIYFT